MFKITKDGLEIIGEFVKLTKDDRKYIHDMFRIHSDYERHPLEKEDILIDD